MDYYSILEQFVPTIDNLPSEATHILMELQNNNQEAKEREQRILKIDSNLRKFLKANGTLEPKAKVDQIVRKLPEITTETLTLEVEIDVLNVLQSLTELICNSEEESKLVKEIEEEFVKYKECCEMRTQLSGKLADLFEKHIKRLEIELEKADDEDPQVVLTAAGITIPEPTFSTPAPVTAAVIPTSLTRQKSAVKEKTLETPVAVPKKRTLSNLSLTSKPVFKKQLKRRMYSSLTREGERNLDEQLYCVCQNVSYGEMIGCDNSNCPYEWFHLECVGLSEPVNGDWLCPTCRPKK